MHPLSRLRQYLRTMLSLLGQTRDQVEASGVELAAHLTQLEAIASSHLAQLETIASSQLAHLEQLTGATEAMRSSRDAQHAQLVEILRFVHDRAHERRVKLRELRTGGTYRQAYTDPDPLVSVVIPTYDNYQLLRDRAIPSVLAQTHQNFEIVVVGDAAPDAARAAVESFGDPRITFSNRLYRGPYPADPYARWLVAGVPPYNEAVHRAQGLWIAPLDDDDAFRSHHIERLLTRVREQGLELCYGQIRQHLPDGSEQTLFRFPPESGAFGVQSCLYHAGLAEIFELELADAALGLPYDWGMCLRMMEADVRIGMVDDETADYFPSEHWTPRSQESSLATIDQEQTDLPPAAVPEWEFVPEGWERAPSVRSWDAAEVAQSYREKWPRFLRALEGPGPLGVSHEVPAGAPIDRHDLLAQNAVLAYAFALGRASSQSRRLSVLDQGGALGHFYVLAKRLYPDVELDYHCRELSAVCAQGREVLPEVTFHDTDDCFERTYDMVIASNSLQYEEDWQRLLRKLANVSARWTFLTSVPVARQHSSFVVLQRAHRYGYATEYLGWVLNRDELLGTATDAGLELERELMLLPEFAVEGAPEAISHAGFLFRADGRP